MNRSERRAAFARARKSETVGIQNGRPIHGAKGALTQSNRSRPHRPYKAPTGMVVNEATSILFRLGVPPYH